MELKNEIINTPLEDVLAYQNQAVIYNFTENFDIPYEESNAIFNETKKWLWACYYSKRDPKYTNVAMTIDDSIIIIDKMWHTFVLFTREYCDFCHTYFSKFIHHSPTTYQEKQLRKTRLRTNQTETLNKERNERERLLSYLYDTLGKHTIIKWYVEYREKYTPAIVLEKTKK